MLTERIQ